MKTEKRKKGNKTKYVWQIVLTNPSHRQKRFMDIFFNELEKKVGGEHG